MLRILPSSWENKFKAYSTWIKRGRYLLAALLAVFLLTRIFGKVRGLEVTSVPVRFEKNYPLYFQSEVSLRPSSESYLTITKGGRLDQLLVKSGALVKKGQILGLVDQIKRTSEARSALAKYQYASREYSRFMDLHRKGVATAQEVDEANRLFEEARAKMEQAKNDLEESVFKAPFDGVVTVAFQVGDVIPDGGRVFIIEDPTEKEFIIKVPSHLRSQVPSETEIHLGELKVMARLEEAVPGSAFDTLGVEYRVRFKLPVSTTYKPGNSVTIKLPLTKLSQVAKFPTDALLSKSGQIGVLTVKNQILEWRPLKLVEGALIQEKGRMSVTEDLPEGVTLVLPPKKILAQNKWAQLIGKRAHISEGKSR